MMYRLASRFTASIGMAGALASAMLFVAPLKAQDSRLSLADRVARLEQQAQTQDQNRLNGVNQQQQMQSQMQQMQGQIEELQHQLQDLQDKSKAQYLDIDSRLSRLEKGGAASPGQAPADAGSAGAPPQGNPGAAAGGPPPQPSAGNPPPSKPVVSSPADKAATQAAYDAAFKSLRAGDYVSASRGFRDFIQKYPNDALTPNAFYWLGESYYVTTNYQVAQEAFQHLLTQFPQSDKAPDAMLKLGYSQLEMKQNDAGTSTLKSVVSKYPGSKAASLAQDRLRRLQQQSAH
jgi:tol-pal system protein YbgF